jgi:sugar/nucleoside kinase (ribokinase family)
MVSVLGIGNALVDVLIRLDSDDVLKKYHLGKGSMQLVEADLSTEILSNTTQFHQEHSSGGSAANTIHGLANLGIKTSFIGKVGDDSKGEFFTKDMQKAGIDPLLFKGTTNTGCAIALISPDTERTFATYLGAAIELSPEDLSHKLFSGYDYFHIEGYLVQNQKLIEQALKLAKANQLTISLDLASYNVVEQNLDFLKEMVKKYVDVVFANEEEARSFTGKEPEEAINILAESCSIAVVKTGKNGSLVKENENLYPIQPIKATSFDTTGAGDLYASGFLFGLSQGFSLDKCGSIGSVLAGKVIEILGAKLHKNAWEESKSLISGI